MLEYKNMEYLKNRDFWTIVVSIIIIGLVIFSFINKRLGSNDLENFNLEGFTEQETESIQENDAENDLSGGDKNSLKFMTLNIFVQDESKINSEGCDATKQMSITVPYSQRIAHESLNFLFNNGGDLSEYANYKDVKIENGIAKIELSNSLTKSGAPISSLSSCQIEHLNSVLDKTLTQYSTVNSVEIFSPEGQIIF
jgi:hypothetical protein